MKARTVFLGILYGLLGILVITLIRNVILTLLTLIYIIVIRPVSLGDNFIFLILNILILVAGFLIGYISRVKENKLYQIFKVSPKSLFLNVIIVFAFLLIINVSGLISDIKADRLYLFGYVLSFIFTFILFLILSFPFSVLLYNLFVNKKIGVVVILFLIIINPITIGVQLLVLPSTINHLMFVNNYEPCGVKIIEFADVSPAKEAGISVGEVIQKIDDTQIVTVFDLDKKLSNNSLTKITVSTNQKDYEVIPINEDNRSKIGIIIHQKSCLKKKVAP